MLLADLLSNDLVMPVALPFSSQVSNPSISRPLPLSPQRYLGAQACHPVINTQRSGGRQVRKQHLANGMVSLILKSSVASTQRSGIRRRTERCALGSIFSGGPILSIKQISIKDVPSQESEPFELKSDNIVVCAYSGNILIY